MCRGRPPAPDEGRAPYLPVRMRWIVLALGVVLALAGGVLLARAGEEPESAPRAAEASAPEAPDAAPAPMPDAQAPDTVIVRRRSGIPGGWAARLRATEGVGAVTRVERGQALVRRAGGTGGRPARRIPAGHVVLADFLAVDPRGYAALLPPGSRPAVERLRPGTALLSKTSARVRRLGRGGTLRLAGGRRLRVVGVVDDGLVRATELVVHRADGPRLSAGRPYLLAAGPADPIRRTLRIPPGRRRSRGGTVVAALGPAPWQVTGGIARPARLKARFGEPALRLPVGDDWVDIDSGFTRRHIASARVPILGTVTCHRRMLPPLRAALGELARRGLARLVDPGDYAGCFAPRRIPGSGSLSLHAWGLAIDLNASANPYGERPRQDRRLVRIFERHGFTWGGRWPTAPDGMHFEFHGEGPTGRRSGS